MEIDSNKFLKGRKPGKNFGRTTAKKIFRGVELGALLAGLGILVTIFPPKHNPDEKVQIGTVQDIEGDEFFNSVPLKMSDNKITQVDDDSLVVINGEIEDGAYSVTALGADFEMAEGTIDKQYVDESNLVDIDDLKYRAVHVYEVSGEKQVNVRSSTSLNEGSMLGKITEGERVLGGVPIESEENGFKWVPVVYQNEEGKIVSAYISADYLIQLDKEGPDAAKLIVDTSKDNYIPLNLRSYPDIDEDNIKVRIPNGAEVEITSIEDHQSEDRNWKHVRYVDEKGNEYIGWVADNYLREPEIEKEEPVAESKTQETEQQKQEVEKRKEVEPAKVGNVSEGMLTDEEYQAVIDGFSTNENNMVVGLDVNAMSPEAMEALFANKTSLPERLYHSEIDDEGNFIDAEYATGDLTQNVDYVYIRIGSRAYGLDNPIIEMNSSDGDNVYKRIELCEKYGIPYGFYFYSAALTNEEAEEEVAACKEFLETIGPTKYNLLPFALNSETEGGVVHRVAGHDVSEIDAHWINTAEPDFGKIVLYTPTRNISLLDENNIINIEVLNENVNSGPVKVWLCEMRTADGEQISSPNSYQAILDQGTDIFMVQTMIDCYNYDEGFYEGMDVDISDKNDLVEVMNERRKEMIKRKEASRDSKNQIDAGFEI